MRSSRLEAVGGRLRQVLRSEPLSSDQRDHDEATQRKEGPLVAVAGCTLRPYGVGGGEEMREARVLRGFGPEASET